MLRESGPAGIEPATCQSQVQRPTAEPPRNTSFPSSECASCHERGNAASITLLQQSPAVVDRVAG